MRTVCRSRRLHGPRFTAIAMLLLFAVSPLAAGCGGTVVAAHPDASRWLSIDFSARRATITLIAAYDSSSSGYNLDGSVKGALRFTVPSGWRVTVRCVNNSTAYRYGCALRKGAGAAVAVPAGLSAPHPPSGLSSGGSSEFSFAAGSPGNYRLAAIESGALPVGMWVALGVTRGGEPTVGWLR